MTIWHTPGHSRPHVPAHPVTLIDMAIFAGGLFMAVIVGVAASGVIPLV